MRNVTATATMALSVNATSCARVSGKVAARALIAPEIEVGDDESELKTSAFHYQRAR